MGNELEQRLTHYDLITPDGCITELHSIDATHSDAVVFIENISPSFVGFEIDQELIFFNLKSTLAQLGVDGEGYDFEIDRRNRCAQLKIRLREHPGRFD